LPRIIGKDEQAALRHVEWIRKQAEREGVDCQPVVTLGEQPYQDIVDVASRSKADIIITGTHGTTGIGRLLMGGVTERVIGHSKGAVSVVKA